MSSLITRRKHAHERIFWAGRTDLKVSQVELEFITPAGNPKTDPVAAPLEDLSDDGTIITSSWSDIPGATAAEGSSNYTPRSSTGNVPKGANQFTYDKSPDGVLSVEVKFTFRGPVGEEEKLKIKLDPVGESQFGWGLLDSAGNSVPDGTPDGKWMVRIGDTVKVVGKFYRLPSQNAAFGNKKVWISYKRDEQSEEVKGAQDYQVFFDKEATNHPGEGKGKVPNWFYYWKNGNVCGIDQSCIYCAPEDVVSPQFPDVLMGKSEGLTLPGTDSLVRIGKIAASENTPVLLRDKRSTIRHAFGGQGKGIQAVAEVIHHEKHHLEIFDKFGILASKGIRPLEDRDIRDVGDGDTIPDEAEFKSYDGVSTSSTDQDTWGLVSALHGSGNNYIGFADNELRCRFREESIAVISRMIHPELDWANPGCQSPAKERWGPAPKLNK